MKEKLSAFEDYQSKSTVVNPPSGMWTSFHRLRRKDALRQLHQGGERRHHPHPHPGAGQEPGRRRRARLLEYAIPHHPGALQQHRPEIILPYEVQLEEGPAYHRAQDRRQAPPARTVGKNPQDTTCCKSRSSAPARRANKLPPNASCAPCSRTCRWTPKCPCTSSVSTTPTYRAATRWRPAWCSKRQTQQKDYRHFNIKTVKLPR